MQRYAQKFRVTGRCAKVALVLKVLIIPAGFSIRTASRASICHNSWISESSCRLVAHTLWFDPCPVAGSHAWSRSSAPPGRMQGWRTDRIGASVLRAGHALSSSCLGAATNGCMDWLPARARLRGGISTRSRAGTRRSRSRRTHEVGVTKILLYDASYQHRPLLKHY
jgi:hypothetical protein